MLEFSEIKNADSVMLIRGKYVKYRPAVRGLIDLLHCTCLHKIVNEDHITNLSLVGSLLVSLCSSRLRGVLKATILVLGITFPIGS